MKENLEIFKSNISEPMSEGLINSAKISTLTSKISSVKKRDYIEIHDEKFFIEKENNTYYLVYPVWSLVGMGSTLREAEDDLLMEAISLLRNIVNMPIKSDNINLREFLFKL